MRSVLLVPARRTGILTGKQGAVQQSLEQSTGTRLRIRGTEVEIEGEPEGVLTAAEIVKAIARGFVPETAMMLLKDGVQLTIISLEGETDKTLRRLMSRVIGRRGRAKQTIERLTGAAICVQGKTVSIVGGEEGLSRATMAVENLLAGRTHAFVFAKLEKMKRLATEQGL